MTTESAATKDAPAPAGLKKGAIGIVAVLFMAVANAAPITAMTATPRSRWDSATVSAHPPDSCSQRSS